MTECRDIDERLANWARWCTSSDGSRGAACMTGAICDGMRKASVGVLPGGEAGVQSVDSNDAVLVGRAMVRLTLKHRRLLGLHYVDGQRKGFIAALLRFPPLEFDRRMSEAQGAIEAAIAGLQNSYRKQFP